MKPKPTLDQVLAELVSNGRKGHTELRQGLIIAFTPANQNNGRFRLCLSRKGKQKPSEQEGKTVTRYLGLALAKIGVDYVDVTRKETAVNGRICIVIEWTQMKQQSLFALEPKQGQAKGAF